MTGLPRVAVVLPLLALAACQDLRGYSGPWVGTVSPDPQLHAGFVEGAALRLDIAAVDRQDLEASVTLPNDAGATRFELIRHASADVLGDMQVDGDPLRSYLGYLRPAAEPGAEGYLSIVTLLSDNHVTVRVIRGAEETYGVFRLRRP